MVTCCLLSNTRVKEVSPTPQLLKELSRSSSSPEEALWFLAQICERIHHMVIPLHIFLFNFFCLFSMEKVFDLLSRFSSLLIHALKVFTNTLTDGFSSTHNLDAFSCFHRSFLREGELRCDLPINLFADLISRQSDRLLTVLAFESYKTIL